MRVVTSVQPGQVFRHERFYLSRETGEFEAKYLLSLATTAGGDLVMRLLTSRAHGRPELPPCYHGMPYPSFYLGIPGKPLLKKSWLDLRGLPDFDPVEFGNKLKRGQIAAVHQIPLIMMLPVLECVANAEDTTRLQERSIRDALTQLRC
jgi:hypothetical protein